MNDPIDPRTDQPQQPDETRRTDPTDRPERYDEPRRPEPTERRDMSNNEPMPMQPESKKGMPWIEQQDIDELRSHWTSVQAQFVDQPCTAIEQADALIADAVERIQKLFTDRQNELRDRWIQRDDASTEELRLTLQEYRSFLNSILDH